jgi:hypothetical protein
MPFRQVAANHFWGIYVNGILKTVATSSPFDLTEVSIANDVSDASCYVYIEDFGLWPMDPHTTIDPGCWAQAEESTFGTRISFGWESPSTFSQANGGVSDVWGDTQLTNISITGMERFTNVEQVPDIPTRGRLSYAIYNNAGTYTIRWFRAALIVAEGTITGNGSVVCSEVNDSGLEVTCTITYTGPVLTSTAYVHLIWPESYQVHYSQSALVFPRSPEMVALDIGGDKFAARSTVLAAGSWNCALLPVRDGVAQAAGITTTTKTINTVPAAATLGTPTGNAAATTIHWTVGEAGCTYKVYSSLIGEPPNLGDFSTPAVVGPTAVDATSAVIPAVAGAPGRIGVIVRATKGGIQETTDSILWIEYDSGGAIISTRPNRASITKVSTSGLTLTVEGTVLSAEKDIAAAGLDLFVVAIGSSFDFTTPQATIALGAAVVGVQKANLSYTAPGAGWYKVAIRAYTAGSLSYAYAERYLPLQTTAPGAASNVTIDVMRGWKGQT